MRSLLLLAFALPVVAAPLEIVRPLLSNTEGGAVLPTGYEVRPGETIFFSCRIRNYQKTSDEKVHLAYTVEAFDPKSLALVEPFHNEITEEVGPQDKDWMPRIATEVPLPPLIG